MAAKDSCRHLWLFSLAHLPKDGVVIWCFFTSPSLADTDHESQHMGGVCGLHPVLVIYARSLLNTDTQGSVGEVLCNQESLRRENLISRQNLKTEHFLKMFLFFVWVILFICLVCLFVSETGLLSIALAVLELALQTRLSL